MTNLNKKLRDQALGKFAEDMAADRYISDGYVVLHRNWRLGKSEIDLIVQKEDTIAFVEVKARSGEYENPEEAVTRDKMKRMIRVSDAYLRNLTGCYQYRFDIVAFTGSVDSYKIEILKDAFFATDIL